jgi:hypothetical protein
MRFWSNLAGYQAVWFITVIGAGRGLAWPALLAAFCFIGWQLALSKQRRLEYKLLAAAVFFGACVEGTLAWSGTAHYATSSLSIPAGGAPLWILSLWASFSMTLTQSLKYLTGRPWLALVFGGAGAPLAYLSAARGWQALTFEQPSWHGLLVLAIGWGIALPLLTSIAHRGR